MKTAMIARNSCFALVAALFVTILPGCGSNEPQHEAKQAGRTVADYPTHAGDEFNGFDQRPARPTEVPPAILTIPPGPTTPTELINLELDNGTLDAGQIKGRNSWIMWTGGNQAFWDYLSTNSSGLVDMLKILDNRHTAREDRFRLMGTIPTPGMRAPNGTVGDQKRIDDEYFGLHLDIPTDKFKDHTTDPDYDVYGYATGIVGLRIWKNPAFNDAAKANWDSERYLYDANYAASPKLIRPFRVGMACGFCHVSYSPSESSQRHNGS